MFIPVARSEQGYMESQFYDMRPRHKSPILVDDFCNIHWVHPWFGAQYIEFSLMAVHILVKYSVLQSIHDRRVTLFNCMAL